MTTPYQDSQPDVTRQRIADILQTGNHVSVFRAYGRALELVLERSNDLQTILNAMYSVHPESIVLQTSHKGPNGNWFVDPTTQQELEAYHANRYHPLS